MNDDLIAEPSYGAWRRSLQRVAAWLTRGNRAFEPPRPDAPDRVEQPSRSKEPSRLPIPPRP